MKGALVIFRKEYRTELNTPSSYVFAVFFLIFSAVWLFFVQSFFARGEASLRPYFEIMPAILAVLMPALTMRYWAEEKRSGTYEVLLTLPFRPGELVVGKYLAAMTAAGLTLALSLSVPLSVLRFGEFDAGVLVTEYLGVLAMASACTALGQLVSSLTRNQVSAFLLSAVVLVVLSMIGRLPALIHLPRFFAEALTWISLNSHFESFVRGVLDSRDLGYFIFVTALSLYLTTKSLCRAVWK